MFFLSSKVLGLVFFTWRGQQLQHGAGKRKDRSDFGQSKWKRSVFQLAAASSLRCSVGSRLVPAKKAGFLEHGCEKAHYVSKLRSQSLPLSRNTFMSLKTFRASLFMAKPQPGCAFPLTLLHSPGKASKPECFAQRIDSTISSLLFSLLVKLVLCERGSWP